jgi:hypothetical protein
MRNLKNQWGDRNPSMSKKPSVWDMDNVPVFAVAACLIIAIMGCSL